MSRLLLLLGLLAGAPAAASEYRRVATSDGRTLLAEITDTTADGLSLSVPQGQVRIGFDQVVGLEEIRRSDYLAQAPWMVVVVPPDAGSQALVPDLQNSLQAALLDVPALTLTTADRQGRLAPTDRTRFAACGAQPDCLQGYLDRSSASVAVSARIEGNDVVVVTAWRQAPRARRIVSVNLARGEELAVGPLRQAVETALHLQPRPIGAPLPTGSAPTAVQPPEPEPQPAVVAAPSPPVEPAAAPADGPTAGTLRALAWVPVPGLPAAVRKDWGGVATSWAVVVPGTAALVGVGGSASFTRGQLLATGLGSYAVLTVALNKATGLRRLPAQVTVQPLPEGGAMLGLSAPLGGGAAAAPGAATLRETGSR